MMNAKENALRIIRFDNPEYMMTAPLTFRVAYRGCNHEGMDFDLPIARHYVKVGVEMVHMGDDLGTQSGPLLGPRILEEFLVPEYRRLFDFYKRCGVLVTFHSCGNIESVVETFMDLGVDVLNPVQATANDLDRVRKMTQGRMALQGAVSSALIMEGPPERIAAEVRKRIRQLGRGGGYFCGPDQGMPFPRAHIDALHDAVATYRPPGAGGQPGVFFRQ